MASPAKKTTAPTPAPAVAPNTVAPLGDTIRFVGFDELPARVRNIPANFDPLAEGVLMAHQQDWLAITVPLAVGEKGRRTGITFAEALGDTILAATSREAGGDNVYYIGDTKEKGLEFIGYCAKFARVIAKAQAQGVSPIEEFIFEDQDPDTGETRRINAYRIRFSSGFQIAALSSNPANIRGLQGKVVLDEVAFAKMVRDCIDAATALLIWGGVIRLISTHNGKNNAFYDLIRDIKAGQYGDETEAVVYRVTFDDAVANGLYERVCLMRGWTASEDGKRNWYNRIRRAYGPRKAQMAEELDAIPRDGNDICIPMIWVERSMKAERPILRVACDEEFNGWEPDEREAWMDDWIDRNLSPVLLDLDREPDYVAGMDYARHRHFSVIIPLAILQNLRRRAPFVMEMQNCPKAQQQQVLWTICRALPHFRGVAIDATGPGQGIAEDTADELGKKMVHQLILNRPWYAKWMTAMIDQFGADFYDLPADLSLSNDFRAVMLVDGVPQIPKKERKDFKDPDLARHGDGAIALCAAEYAAQNRVMGSTPPRSRPKTQSLLRGYGLSRRGSILRGYK